MGSGAAKRLPNGKRRFWVIALRGNQSELRLERRTAWRWGEIQVIDFARVSQGGRTFRFDLCARPRARAVPVIRFARPCLRNLGAVEVHKAISLA
jgi:hypothetical protein